MDAYLINLARRPDRRDKMATQLAALGVPLRPVDAIDARTTPDAEVDRVFAAGGPLGPLPKGDKCCTLSHRRTWEMFLASGDDRALILEDDVEIDAAGAPLLRDSSWIPDDVGLLKIERFGPASQRVLLSDMRDVGGGRQIGRIRSKHTGGAAYILSRDAARLLLAWPGPWTLPVDHMLFNPNNSPLFEALAPWQLTPVVARQTEEIGGGTDIDEWRVKLRSMSWSRIGRELVRAYYDVRLVPRQIAGLLLGKARLVRVDPGR
jgi:glycosyl transferase, family 25